MSPSNEWIGVTGAFQEGTIDDQIAKKSCANEATGTYGELRTLYVNYDMSYNYWGNMRLARANGSYFTFCESLPEEPSNVAGVPRCWGM